MKPLPPTAYPAPGVYNSPQMITLLSPAAQAQIHYTLDKSPPTLSSPLFDPYRLIPMIEFGQEPAPDLSNFTIRAIAVLDDAASEISTFTYSIVQRSRDEYISEEVAPGVRMIRDFDNDNMYLITGSRRALLIDCGMGSGDLRGYVESFSGGLPLDVLITHAHPDHIAKMGQFQADCAVYMHLADLPMVKNFIEQMQYEIDPAKITDIREGFVFDLGDRRLTVYHVPGHSKGCLALLDEENEILFAGDAIGSNRPTSVDALWMQWSEDSIDEFLATLQGFRAKVAGKIKVIYGGHNDSALLGEAYLDHLEEAAQRLVDQGEAVLVPSPRPSGVWQVVSGDRLTDPNWAAINVNREECLSAPSDKIASLSSLRYKELLNEEFKPGNFHYTAAVEPGAAQVTVIPTATSRRYGGLKINGSPAASGQPLAVGPAPITIEVFSPDRTVSHTYRIETGS